MNHYVACDIMIHLKVSSYLLVHDDPTMNWISDEVIRRTSNNSQNVVDYTC